jgi:dTDP-glucose pyrophosphorylase
MEKNIKKYLFSENSKLIDAVNSLEKISDKCLIIINTKNKLKGTITDGDIRRAILKGVELNSGIKKVYKKNPVKIYLDEYNNNNNYNYNNLFSQDNYRIIPIVNRKNEVVNLLKGVKNFNDKNNIYSNKFKNVNVVIMSGGEGKRLLPYTTVIPKPLVPVNDKPIIDHIIDRFKNLGVNNFYLTVNYKMNLIKAYFFQKKNKFKINFLSEKKPLGSAGSLAFLRKKIKKNFFLTNCDSLVISNYQSIYKFHEKKDLDLTIVCSKKNYHVPYGTCLINNKSMLASIEEKPTYNFLINTGFYVVNPKVLKFIKKNEYLAMDVFIKFLLKKKIKIGVYQIDENSWLDFGQWNVFNKSAEFLKNK